MLPVLMTYQSIGCDRDSQNLHLKSVGCRCGCVVGSKLPAITTTVIQLSYQSETVAHELAVNN